MSGKFDCALFVPFCGPDSEGVTQMANILKIDRRVEKQKQRAAKNRREIIAAGLSRREMLRLGLLTSAGLLVPMSGLSVRARSSAGRLLDGGSSGSGSG